MGRFGRTADAIQAAAASTKTAAQASGKLCVSCGTTNTPLWRRNEDGESVCNACGLYLKSNKMERPAWLRRLEENRMHEGAGDGVAERCANCMVTSTPLWRRDDEGRLNCNACGLYFKLHGMARPVGMIQKAHRKRNPDPCPEVPAGGTFSTFRIVPRQLPPLSRVHKKRVLFIAGLADLPVGPITQKPITLPSIQTLIRGLAQP
ncbi:hypothetical protein HDU91_000052 [Kappamyces sp. JEL0680]|nr:hypothetical protein HDU91_000052 [Kappamyces sp. JEL0680]